MTSGTRPTRTLSVRDVVEFVHQRGDLGSENDFSSPKRAMEGIRGHQRVVRSRPPDCQKEVPLCRSIEAKDFTLNIQGRCDAIWMSSEGIILEEIKTVRSRWSGQSDPLHWAQVKFYGFIFAEAHSLEKVTLQLTYLELHSLHQTEFRESFTLDQLSAFFHGTVQSYVDWMLCMTAWQCSRNESITSLPFPFPHYRPGQRMLAVSVYRSLSESKRLFIEAPTGIGKTISVLYPAIKALGENKFEKLFYLTARTLGRTVVESALDILRKNGLKLRAVTLTAKEKICFGEQRPCDTSVCPYAKGYYDRRKPAIVEALQFDAVTRKVVEILARAHQICPFELSLDVSTWADAVICDYNYVFNPHSYLRRHFHEDPPPYGFLVDEAHNLAERAREMYSAAIHVDEVLNTARLIKKNLPHCSRTIKQLASLIHSLSDAKTSSSPAPIEAEPQLDFFDSSPAAGSNSQESPPVTQPALDLKLDKVRVLSTLPEQVIIAVEKTLSEIESWLLKNETTAFRPQLLDFFFQLRAFSKIAALYGHNYVTVIHPGHTGSLQLSCLNPSPQLDAGLTRSAASVLFSATLSPLEYYRSVLGGKPDSPVLQLASPFPPENLCLLVQDRIHTHLKARASTLDDVAHAIGAVVEGRCGNYLVYFPSYQYLANVHTRFQTLFPALKTHVQQTGMSENERETFLSIFSATPTESLVGFAVMGGIFGEGIDLVGDRLIGVIVVGVGLPQLSFERNLIRDYFQQINGMGFEYAYTYPGMNRVLQAVGRVIRSEADRGVVLLIDSRFKETRYLKLFPAWWHPIKMKSLTEIKCSVSRFWAASNGRFSNIFHV